MSAPSNPERDRTLRIRPFRITFLALIALVLTACQVGKQANTVEEMLATIHARTAQASSHYDRLWYQGMLGDRLYFKHIRGYFLDEVIFSMPRQQFPDAPALAYSTNSDNWYCVENIGQQWHSASRDMETANSPWQNQECGAPWRVWSIQR